MGGFITFCYWPHGVQLPFYPSKPCRPHHQSSATKLAAPSTTPTAFGRTGPPAASPPHSTPPLRRRSYWPWPPPPKTISRSKWSQNSPHTIPKLACPATNSGNSIFLSTMNYNSEIAVDAVNLAVTADSGVGLRDVINAVEAAGLSLVPAPYWEGVSVGGLISTGAHGSSWWGKGGSVHDHVIGLSLIVPANESEGYAKVLRLGLQDPLFDAAKVTFSLEQAFKRSITYNFTDDGGIEDKFGEHAKSHEFADITWYPSKHEAVYRYDDRVPSSTVGDGVNDFLGFQSNSILISKSTRATGIYLSLFH
ncbi:D-arabinono-1,4-lactone oxidase family protein [Actinidia rufa]|uniref:D-arabinono-1,4-lactone oxidase family protein n=1 Tax=Actinidia rufa TaxID=165716 RepID=A0A7J0GCD3_9ERIC|nr:D-arabinono-1,4-lactone oxidase family protein [Actinidia rufa]